MPKTLHIKGSRTKVLNTFPTSSVGNDGDIIISRIKGRGVYLCTKAGGTWYVANKLQEIRKIEHSSIKELSTNKLTINGIINASKDTDRFVVSDSGQLKYRTSGEVVDDLDIPVVDIYYKNAYCSLGQYTNEEDCMANGGEWYYSDNDSHDSISSTAENELLTIGKSIGSLDAEPTLLYDGSTLEIKYNSDFDDNWQTSAQTDLLKFSYGSSSTTMNLIENGDFTIASSRDIIFDANTDIELNADGGQVKVTDGINTHFMFNCDTTRIVIYDDADFSDYLSLAVGANGVSTISTNDNDGAVGHLTLAPDGDLVLDPVSQKTIINATDALYLDGGGDTYITESSADVLKFVVGNDTVMELSEAGGEGNLVNMGISCAGFTTGTITYDATDTLVYFSRLGNKAFLTFDGGDITDLHLIFPDVSGNFLLVIKQDGTGSRTITNYKTFDQGVGAERTVYFAGGSNPTLTTTASKIDILSFFWNNDDHRAYGTITHNF